MSNLKCSSKVVNAPRNECAHFTFYFLQFTQLFLPFFLLLFFTSCHNNTAPKTPAFGESDTLSIAADTTMQVAIENSHEFLQTLTASSNDAYDVKASSYFEDGVEHKKFLILHRNKENKEDTILSRNYPTEIARAELADLDNDKVKEIIVYYNSASTDVNFTHIASVLICKPARKGHVDFVLEMNAGAKDLKYKSSDSFHDTLYFKDNFLVRKYPLYEHRKDSIPKGTSWIYYQLKAGKFEEVKKEAVL